MTTRFLALFGVLSLGALGAIVPWLGGRLLAAGMDPADLGLLMAMLPAGRLAGAPLWGWAADRWRVSGLLLQLGCAMALLGVVMLIRAEGAGQAAAAVLVFALGRVPLGPLVDAAMLEALAAEGRGPEDYGRLRLWGSAGFAACVALGGQVADPLRLCLALSAGALLLSLRFPLRGAGGHAPVLPALRALSASPGFGAMLAWAALQAMTVSVYDTFYSVHVRERGMPGWVLWGSVVLGVAVEIGVMRLSARILGRLGVERALLLASATGLIRWPLTALAPSPLILLLTQSLHGTTFALFWLAGVQWFALRAPPAIAASAQSLYAAASYGLGALAGALLAGRLQQSGGSGAIFWGMSVVSLAATALAARLVSSAGAAAHTGSPRA